MLIGIDMLGVQSPGSRGRGIGRLSSSVVAQLLGLDPSVHYVLYAHEGLPTDEFPTAPNATRVVLRREPERGETRLSHVMGRLARENPEGLDALLVLSPFELHEGYGTPPKPLRDLTLAAIVYDLIPFRYQERYLTDPGPAAEIHRRLEGLRHYDVLLAISEATRDDFRSMLGLAPGRAVNIGAACDAGTFGVDRAAIPPASLRRKLHNHGITGSFIYCVSNFAYHKNVHRLIDAFALLPGRIRRSHHLLLTCGGTPEDAEAARRHAHARGVGDRFVLSGPMNDEELRLLYQRCAVFCFPSLYEGFGLPLLEAMHCGAPVVAGNNSSQVEVVGDAGLLVNAADASDVAEKLTRILTNPALAADLGARARERAATFSWRRTAERTFEALTAVVRRKSAHRTRSDRAQESTRPRLAVFSPFPPKKSGISDYTARLIEYLKPTYAIDLYHDSGYVPEPALKCSDFAAYDHRLFDRNAAILDYRAVLYQMGNSWYHNFLYETMRRHPGIVTLHDFNLAGFHWSYSQVRDGTHSHFARQFEFCCPIRAARYLALLPDWMREPGGIQAACSRRGLFLNREIFEWSRRVVVHSPWCVVQAAKLFPDQAHKATLIPFGTTASTRTTEQRAAIRDRFGLPRGALIFASFGYLTRDKMNTEAITAFAALADDYPEAIFAFVGQDYEGGEARRLAESLGILGRVAFLGHRSASDFADLVAISDIGINLRRPPTYGETSAALLDLLRSGIPAIVTDVATFSDYPDSVVRKVRWDSDGMGGLIAAMRELAADAVTRESLGRAALRYVHETHTWEQAAALYVDAIESTFEAHSKRMKRWTAPPFSALVNGQGSTHVLERGVA